jgi:hypothetical protein
MLTIAKYLQHKQIRNETAFLISKGVGLWQINGGITEQEMENLYPINGTVINRNNKHFYKGENPDKTKI